MINRGCILALLVTALTGVAAGSDVDLDGVEDDDEDEILEFFAPVWKANDFGTRPPLPLDFYVGQCVLRRYETDQKFKDKFDEEFEQLSPLDFWMSGADKNPQNASGGIREIYYPADGVTPQYLIDFDYAGGAGDYECYRLRFAGPTNGLDHPFLLPEFDPVSWTTLQEDQKGVYGRVYPLQFRRRGLPSALEGCGTTCGDVHIIPGYHVVQYFLFFGYNDTDNPGNNTFGPCGHPGDHQGDVICVEFLVRWDEGAQSGSIVNAVFNNHGRKTYVDDPSSLAHDSATGRVIVYLEREAQEPHPWAGACGFDDTITDSNLGASKLFEGTTILDFKIGYECDDYQVVREHHGDGSTLCVTEVVNIGEDWRDIYDALSPEPGLTRDHELERIEAIRVSPMTTEAKLLHIFPGMLGDAAFTDVCICGGCWCPPFGCCIQFCFTISQLAGSNSPYAPSKQWKLWDRRDESRMHPVRSQAFSEDSDGDAGDFRAGNPIGVQSVNVVREDCTIRIEVELTRAVGDTSAAYPVVVELYSGAFCDACPTECPGEPVTVIDSERFILVEPGTSAGSLTLLVVAVQSEMITVVVRSLDTGDAELRCFEIEADVVNVQAARLVNGDAIDVTWNPVCGANRYSIHRGLAPDDLSLIASDVTELSWTDTSALDCTLYYYALQAHLDGVDGNLSIPALGFRSIPIDSLVVDAPWIQGERIFPGLVTLAVEVPPGQTEVVTVESDDPSICQLYPDADCAEPGAGCSDPSGLIELVMDPGEIDAGFAAHFFPQPELARVAIRATTSGDCEKTVQLWVNPVTDDWAFTESALLAVPFDPTALVSADFDRDGDPDLATSSGSAGLIGVVYNDGAGAFANPIWFPVGFVPSGLWVADVNGDGWRDLLTSNATDGALVAFVNQGNGVFSPVEIDSPSAPAPVGAVRSSDLDGDGDLDLVRFWDGSFRILWSNGDGSFEEAIPFSPPEVGGFDGLAAFDLGDVNGDELDDLVISTDGAGVVVYPNQVFSFGPGVDFIDIGVIPGAITDVALADLDGDERLDAVVVSVDPESPVRAWVSLARQGPNGWDVGVQKAYFERAVACAVRDFDGDGDGDLAVLQRFVQGQPDGHGILGLLRANGPAVFGAPEERIMGDQPADLLPLDIDGDGDLDLVITNEGGDSISILRNDFAPPGPFQLAGWTHAEDTMTTAPRLRWSHAAGKQHYRVIVSTSPNFEGEVAEFIVTENELEIPDGMLEVGTLYHWAVEAIGARGQVNVASPRSGSFYVTERSILDCNENGLHDPDEIAGGLAEDLDGDGIIDTCMAGACPLDLDDDGIVGLSDVLAVLANWGPCPSCACVIDADLDCEIGFQELLYMLSAWGSCP